MTESEKIKPITPPPTQYQFPEEGLYLGLGPHRGTYDPPPPYLTFGPSTRATARTEQTGKQAGEVRRGD